VATSWHEITFSAFSGLAILDYEIAPYLNSNFKSGSKGGVAVSK